MLTEMMWATVSGDLNIEIEQSRDEGRDVTGFEERAKEIKNSDEPLFKKEQAAAAFYDEIGSLPVKKGYKHIEPNDIESIRAVRPGDAAKWRAPVTSCNPEDAFDKIYGAWLGRCCGCLLGKPIEGWYRERITGLLRDTGNYPIKRYISSDISSALRDKYNVSDKKGA